MSGKRNWSAYNERDTAPPVIVASHKPIAEPEKEWEKVPVWKQEALDEQGRKRLHGAFRGGYSAGYFNTVGSKEGWTPTAFKSSRKNRANFAQARPTDFMDEEDLEEAAEQPGENEEVDLNALGMTETEIALQKKKQEELENSLYGAGASSGGISGAASHKNYDQPLQRPEIKKPAKKNFGMGVGVFNDDGEDDEDVYEIKPKSDYDKVLGGEKKKKKKKKKVEAAAAATTTTDDSTVSQLEEDTDSHNVLGRHVFVSRKGGAFISDDRATRDADAATKTTNAEDDIDATMDEIPEHDNSVAAKFGPDAKIVRKPKGNQKKEEKPKEEEPKEEKKQEKTTTVTKSVFDFMKPAARDKIAAATGKTDLPPALGESGPEGYVSNVNLEEMVPRLEADIAANALKGFLPYADDLKKRDRYKAFLEVKAGVRDGLPLRKLGMSNEDWAKEMREFVSGARIFKPATGMMASRFTSSSSRASQIPTGDGRSQEVKLQYASDLRSGNEDPALAAVKMSMYGPMTRTVTSFYPSRLLCKRFNVRAPAHSEPGNDEYPATSSFNERAQATAEFSASFRSSMDAVSKAGIVGFTSAKATPTHIPGSMPSPPPPPTPQNPQDMIPKTNTSASTAQTAMPPSVGLPLVNPIETEKKKAGDAAYKRIFGDDSEEDETD